jgi:hypothetical protein
VTTSLLPAATHHQNFWTTCECEFEVAKFPGYREDS